MLGQQKPAPVIRNGKGALHRQSWKGCCHVEDQLPDGLARFLINGSSLNLLVLQIAILLIAFTLWRHTRHPLYHFPGPRLASWSNVLHSYWYLNGRLPYKILELHEKYGPVVRTAPNDLSFASATSWKDIYGSRQGHQTFKKSSFYDGFTFADFKRSIITERDPAAHGEMRKQLSHAFADRSVEDQEALVNEGADELIQRLAVHATDRNEIDIAYWFDLTAVDIIGSLAFGTTFGGLNSGKHQRQSLK